VSALGHYLEEEGIATVVIALIRPQAENTRPPRALWVPFELGRPIGPPGDAAFQKRVILAALGIGGVAPKAVTFPSFELPCAPRLALPRRGLSPSTARPPRPENRHATRLNKLVMSNRAFTLKTRTSDDGGRRRRPRTRKPIAS